MVGDCLSVWLFHLLNVLQLHPHFCNDKFLRLDVCVPFPSSVHVIIDTEINTVTVVSRATKNTEIPLSFLHIDLKYFDSLR